MHKYLRNGIEEQVEPEQWQWEAHYNDGTVLKQFADDGVFHQFREIDQTRLNLFKMVSADKARHFSLLFNPGMKLIHFYRNIILNDGEIRCRLYCFGYEQNIGGRTYKNLHVIMPDGNPVITDNIEKITIEV